MVPFERAIVVSYLTIRMSPTLKLTERWVTSGQNLGMKGLADESQILTWPRRDLELSDAKEIISNTERVYPSERKPCRHNGTLNCFTMLTSVISTFSFRAVGHLFVVYWYVVNEFRSVAFVLSVIFSFSFISASVANKRVHISCSASALSDDTIYAGWPKKYAANFCPYRRYDRFSNFFHLHILRKICNKAVTKYRPTTTP